MNKAILFCTVLFIVPLLYQEVDAVEGQETINFTVSHDGFLTDTDNSGTCAIGDDFDIQASSAQVKTSLGTYASAQTNDCDRTFYEWDTTSIPDGATITALVFYNEQRPNEGASTCSLKHMALQPSVTNLSTKVFFDDLGNGVNYIFNSNWCIFDDNPITLPASARTDLQNQLGVNWFAMGFVQGSESQSSVDERTAYHSRECTSCLASQRPILQITYNHVIDPVDVLVVSKFVLNGVDLLWEAPNTFGSVIQGYQINFTTPHGDPITPITNNTFSQDTTATITSLLSDTNYTFRLTAVTVGQNINPSGKLLNLTTISLGNFTIGFASLDADNFDARDIKYRRIDEANDITKLEVVYPNAFNLTCVMDYRFQNTNQTFSNLITVPESTDGGGIPALAEQKATFTFINASKEVIRVLCTDVNTNASAPFLLTVTQFPLINQLLDFRAGEFGTDGMLGAVDIITLGVVVMVMIGFNRWNESVGAIFAVGLLGGLSFFQIVEWQTFMFGTFAVVIMVVIGSTRKN